MDVVEIYKRCFLALFFISFWSSHQAQTVSLVGRVEDCFLKKPLPNALISIFRGDSTLVADSVNVMTYADRNGRLLAAQYMIHVDAKYKIYLVRSRLQGYDEAWQQVNITEAHSEGGTVQVPMLEMRKMKQMDLDEVLVKATKVKMYYKGDTLVYDADAFKLPDGSMLDALIRQLPGVTMNDGGEIFVNGRKVEELLLGSHTFFRGNKKVLMENLPYYTVKDVKVYEKQTDKSEALGHDVEPRRFVMDVNLRNEYSQGYIANVEASGGTEKRYLGRAFLLAFTDRFRFSLLGNLNNVNETRHVGETGYWSPNTLPNQIVTTRSVATDFNYHTKGDWLKETFNASFTSSSYQQDMCQRREQFLEGSVPVSFTELSNRLGNRKWNLHNSLTLKKPGYFNMETDFNYAKLDGSFHSAFEQWDDTLISAMRTVGMSEGQTLNGKVSIGMAFNVGKNQECENGTCYQRYMNLGLILFHENDQSEQANRYTTEMFVNPLYERRYNVNDYKKKNTSGYFSLGYVTRPYKNVSLQINERFGYVSQYVHDYLYHPDTLMLASQIDALVAITDPGNSYRGHSNMIENRIDIALFTEASYKIGLLPILYRSLEVGVRLPVQSERLDYQRGVLDTLVYQKSLFANPWVSYRYMSQDGRRDFRFRIDHSRNSPYLYDRIDYRDDSQPLVVKLGNPNLKGSVISTANADYTDRKGDNQQQYHLGISFQYYHRDVAQSVTYNPLSGIYTYCPLNVSGAYMLGGKFDISRALDEKRYWTWQMNADANYDHSVDHAMLAGETESHVNAVNTTVLHDGTYIQYNKDAFNIRASGDIRWRHSEGRMRDFETLDALDFNYGLSARYTLPRIKTTLSADATMYSRRGYGSAELNTDDFVLNASLSQPFWKGKLIARIEAFDLLHQVSSTQYSVNAQGRTETWFRSLPHYVMLHLVYHWNRNPKKP